MTRYVVLLHEMPTDAARATHWDLMLESGPVLRTWALEKLPSAGSPAGAHQLADHRLEYLEYEGEVSGGRGTVRQWDAGEFDVLRETPMLWEVQLRGREIAGRLLLSRESAELQRWTVSFFPESMPGA